MRHFLTLTVLTIASLALAGGSTPATAQPTARPTTRDVPCPEGVKASRCTFVKVPLDHAKPGGEQIELFVAVQQARVAGTPDPLFYLEGGPGGPSSVSVGPLSQVFPNRDLVGIDQRGIGRSRPSLACGPVGELMKRQDMKAAELLPLFSQALTDCGQELRGKGVKLEYFNTSQAALDVDAVRRALGYGQINLYGASYGTRLAQEVMRRAPQGLRAVVLDSVIPASVDRAARTPAAIQEAAARVFAACRQDAACNAKYPDLSSRYRAVIKQLDARPLKLEVKGAGGELNGSVFQGLFFNSMYFVPGLQEIPGLIAAAEAGDVTPIRDSFAVKFLEMAADTLTWPAFFTNECMGEVAYSSPEKLRAGLGAAPQFASALSLAPGISSQEIFNVCRNLKLTAPAPQENDPVGSDVPTLLLAGEFDPVTPPGWLPEAAQKLNRSRQVIIAGASHGAGLTGECGYTLVMTFLQAPDKALDTGCAAQGRLSFK